MPCEGAVFGTVRRYASVFLRLALGAAFLSGVADRFGLERSSPVRIRVRDDRRHRAHVRFERFCLLCRGCGIRAGSFGAGALDRGRPAPPAG